jgi:hypothetical protein
LKVRSPANPATLYTLFIPKMSVTVSLSLTPEALHAAITHTEATLAAYKAALAGISVQESTTKRTRSNTGANEEKDISLIVEALHLMNPRGIKIASAFKEEFGLVILDARPRKGASRGKHYDFEVLISQAGSTGSSDNWMRVEHKGSKNYVPINPTHTPWQAGVQFHNGGCEKYSFAKYYAKTWYDLLIGSSAFTTEFNIKADIPSYEEWFQKDCKAQGTPNTKYGIELKKTVRNSNGSLRDKRKMVFAALDIDEHKAQLIKEVLPIANEALEEKDYWMAIHGDLTGDFYVKWYPKFRISEIHEVVISKDLDINMVFHCNDGFSFKGILRWGRGAGFSNLRIDLK